MDQEYLQTLVLHVPEIVWKRWSTPRDVPLNSIARADLQGKEEMWEKEMRKLWSTPESTKTEENSVQ